MPYNGWTNWETWVTVTHLEDVPSGMEADDIEQMVRDGIEIDILAALREQFIEGALEEVNWSEIADAFEDEDEPQDPDGYEERERY